MATLSKHHAVVDALVVVADVKPGDIGVVIGQPLGKAHRTLNATVALEVTAAGAERQLLLQARFVEPDDPAAVVRPAHVVVSVLAPAVLKLQGHQEMQVDKLFQSVPVPVAPKLTTRADCALISVCRVAAVVNRRSAQPAETD